MHLAPTELSNDVNFYLVGTHLNLWHSIKIFGFSFHFTFFKSHLGSKQKVYQKSYKNCNCSFDILHKKRRDMGSVKTLKHSKTTLKNSATLSNFHFSKKKLRNKLQNLIIEPKSFVWVYLVSEHLFCNICEPFEKICNYVFCNFFLKKTWVERFF